MNDDFARYVGTGLAVVMTPLALAWLRRSARVPARCKGGVFWLEYGPAMKWFALLCVVMAVSLGVGVFHRATKHQDAVVWLFLLFAGLTLPLLIEFFLVRIGFDGDRIYCHSGWRRKRVIEWSDVASYRYSPMMQWWVIGTEKSGKIRAHIFLSGLDDLLAELSRRGVRSA
jgi:hypothetical protein